MEYKFQQRPLPSNATGVPVVLTALVPNGNYLTIGNVTSDLTGTYSQKFTPEVPGTYQIIATFAGSNSYYASAQSTYLTISEGTTATPVATAQPQSVADTYFVSAIAGLFVLIIAGLIVLALLILRKRK